MNEMTVTESAGNSYDVLTLLALKIAPRQFDLSFRFSNISIRDQIVRAQMLVQQLVALKLVGEELDPRQGRADFDLLICGAGAAGLAAALEAERLGASFLLIDRDENAGVGGVLRSPADRYVSTAMYEWPHENAADHAFPLDPVAFEAADVGLRFHTDRPLRSAELGAEIDRHCADDLQRWLSNASGWGTMVRPFPKSVLLKGARIDGTSLQNLQALAEPRVSLHAAPIARKQLDPIIIDQAGMTESLRYRFVVYAIGYSKETEKFASREDFPPPYSNVGFWQSDEILKPNLGFTCLPKVAIIGSGDGALQDVLRCLLTSKHPTAAWQVIAAAAGGDSSIEISSTLRRVATLDMHATAAATWSSAPDLYRALDRQFYRIVDSLLASGVGERVASAVLSMVRNDVAGVVVFTQHGHFSKAYALNRFLVILLARVLDLPKRHGSPIVPTLQIIQGPVTGFSCPTSRGGCLHIQSAQMKFPLIIFRAGLSHDIDERFHHRIGLSGRDTGRASLGRIPLPIRPPKL